MYDPVYDPVEHLDALGVRLVRHKLESHDAIWIPERRMVIVDRGIRADRCRPVLAHECVHVEHDDLPGHNPRQENRADLVSARRLINEAEWAVLTRTHEDYDYICNELGVTRQQFLAFNSYKHKTKLQGARLERIGSMIYLDPRMGARQWAKRAEVA